MTVEQSRRRHRARECVRKGILYVLLTAGGFTSLVPLFWMVSTSLKPAGAVFVIPPEWIPRRQVQETVGGEELPVHIADLPDGPRRVGRMAFVPGGAKVKLLDEPGRGEVLEVPTRRVLVESGGRQAVVQPARMPAHQDALPVADVAAQLGGEAALDPVRRTWVLQLGEHRLKGRVGKRIASLDGQPLQLVTEPFTEDGKLMLPAAVFRDLLGLQMTSEKLLRPVRCVDIRWQNYPEAWSKIRLEEPMFAWSLPYALVSKLGGGKWRIGPVRFRGLQIMDSFFAFYINSLLVAVVVT
ncbi:MAG: stalk domain-containing protein, partial [Armatimonadota bacterium]